LLYFFFPELDDCGKEGDWGEFNGVLVEEKKVAYVVGEEEQSRKGRIKREKIDLEYIQLDVAS